MLRDHLDHDQAPGAGRGARLVLADAAATRRSTRCRCCTSLLLGATYTLVFWLPTLIKSWGVGDLFMIGIFAAIPNVFGVIGMVLIGRSSDRTKERRWHFAACTLIAARGLAVTLAMQGNFVGSLIGLCDRHDRHRLGDADVLHDHVASTCPRPPPRVASR